MKQLYYYEFNEYIREGIDHLTQSTSLQTFPRQSTNQTSDTSFKFHLPSLTLKQKRREKTQPKVQPIYKGSLVPQNSNRKHSTHNTTKPYQTPNKTSHQQLHAHTETHKRHNRSILTQKACASMKCQKCQKEVFLPFKCPYCGDYFCSEHRLPENHECPRIEHARAPKQQTQPIIIQKQRPYEYTISYSPRFQAKKFRFSQKELKHLTVGALLVMGVGISFILQILGSSEINRPEILLSLVIIFTFSFLLHEIAHKLSAQGYGLWAEFRLTLFGALITLLSMLPFAFFKIISPGAVMIAGAITRKQAGKTALAGPLTNITLSTIFTPVAIGTSGTIAIITGFGAWINAIIAIFNLIPFSIMDGLKVFRWNKVAWILAFAASLILTVVSYIYILQV
jgi:Zn-dependent protease